MFVCSYAARLNRESSQPPWRFDGHDTQRVSGLVMAYPKGRTRIPKIERNMIMRNSSLLKSLIFLVLAGGLLLPGRAVEADILLNGNNLTVKIGDWNDVRPGGIKEIEYLGKSLMASPPQIPDSAALLGYGTSAQSWDQRFITDWMFQDSRNRSGDVAGWKIAHLSGHRKGDADKVFVQRIIGFQENGHIMGVEMRLTNLSWTTPLDQVYAWGEFINFKLADNSTTTNLYVDVGASHFVGSKDADDTVAGAFCYREADPRPAGMPVLSIESAAQVNPWDVLNTAAGSASTADEAVGLAAYFGDAPLAPREERIFRYYLTFGDPPGDSAWQNALDNMANEWEAQWPPAAVPEPTVLLLLGLSVPTLLRHRRRR